MQHLLWGGKLLKNLLRVTEAEKLNLVTITIITRIKQK